MIATGWGEVEAGMVADWRAGFTIREVAKRSGWSTEVVSRVLRSHGCDVKGKAPGARGTFGGNWTVGEFAAVMFAKGPADALERHRARFPDSGRTPGAIRKMYKKAKREGAMFHGLKRLQEGLV
jgi:hypothetical protein